MCNNYKHKTWLDHMAQPCLHLQESTKPLPSVCWHCHSRSVNHKDQVDEECQYWLMHTGESVFENTHLPSPKIILTIPRSTLHCITAWICIMHLQTYLHHSQWWSHSALQRKPSSKMSIREQVLQLTIHEKKSTDCARD